MKSKASPSDMYLPASSKNYTYYPIQSKKALQPSIVQPTMRVERRQKDVDVLRRANEQMRERQDVYIEKLMKLEEGLQNQNREFIKLQELYTELFESYKQKELEIAQLEFKYRETGRQRAEDSMDLRLSQERREGGQRGIKESQYAVKQTEWTNREKEWKLIEYDYVKQNAALAQKLVRISENYQKLVIELNSAKSRSGGDNSKLMQQLQQWQRRSDSQKQDRLKYQYENEFLRKRNQDLEEQRVELEKLLEYKEKSIAKLREEKIKIHRQTSQKMMTRSPSQSSRSALKMIQEEENNGGVIAFKDSKGGDENMDRQLMGSSRMQQYFSFSRDKKQSRIEADLPHFPAELEIDSLINEHRQEGQLS